MFGGKKGSAFDEKNTVPTVEHGAGSIVFGGLDILYCVWGRVEAVENSFYNRTRIQNIRLNPP